MSFGQELKDFASGYGMASRALYQNEARKKMKRENDENFDLDAAARAEGAEGHEDSGIIYDLGKWFRPKKKAAGPLKAVDVAQSAPLDGFAGVNTSAFAPPAIEPLQEEQAFASGGLVLPEDEVMVSATRALPLDEDQVVATGYRAPPDNDGRAPIPEDAGDDDGRDPFAAMPASERAVDVRQLAAIPNRDLDGRAPIPEDAGDDDGRDPQAAMPRAETAVDAANLGDPTRQVAAADVEGGMKYTLGNALDGGIRALMKEFKLDPNGGAIPDEQGVKSGQAALMSGQGRASTEDVKAAVAAVDPDGKLSHSQAMLRAMTKGYEFYMERGDPAKANNYAAMIIQYSVYQASKHGEDALKELKAGNIEDAAESLRAGYANIPDGKEAMDVKVRPDGKSVSVTESDVQTGKKIAEHTLTGEQLYQAAIGLADKSSTWNAIMSAAQAVKNVNLPQSEAFENAQLALAGANPDGSPITSTGNTGSDAPAIPAQTAARSGSTPPAQNPGATASLPQPSAAGASYEAMMRAGESSGNPNAKNGDSMGLYQIQSAAWRDHTGHDPIVNGKDERLDPVKNKAVFDKLTAANTAQFKAKTNRDPSPLELAVMHQQGAVGGMALMLADANQPAAQVLRSIGVKNPEAHLTGNRIPANATAGQAVQAVQAYYGKHAPQGQPGLQRMGAQPAPLDLRPPLPEDTSPPVELPQKPTPPAIVRADAAATRGMSPDERKTYIRQVARTNQENAKKFTQDMQLYTTALKAAKAPAKGKDPLALPVKDRGDAAGELEKAKAAFVDDATNPTSTVFASMQPGGQRAADDLAYALYTHNDTTPQRAYQAAVSMLASGATPKPDGTLNISTPFTPHKLEDGNVKIVFRTGDKMVIPRNAFDQLAAVRGNEIYVARQAAQEAARKSGQNAALLDKGKKALKATPGAAVGALDVAVNAPVRAVKAVPGAVAEIPGALKRMSERSMQRAQEENKTKRPVSIVK